MRLTVGEALRWERGRLGRMLNSRIRSNFRLCVFNIQNSEVPKLFLIIISL